jgi:hypothetical protein
LLKICKSLIYLFKILFTSYLIVRIKVALRSGLLLLLLDEVGLD